MKTITTPIIPVEAQSVKIKNVSHQIDKKAICIFTATGFFLDQDSYFIDRKILPPASICEIDDSGYLHSSNKWFEWHYEPRDISFEAAVDEFSVLFEQIIAEQVQNKTVILPLSGGLDSRTQALACTRLDNTIISYSYSFENGYQESSIARKIAQACNFEFHDFTIPKGYLWNSIEELATLNNCHSDFTHPRQMAVIDEFKRFDGIFNLGHWGDVLFDKGIKDNPSENIVTTIKAKIIKKGGLELAKRLWLIWELEGSFEDYLEDRLNVLWNTIPINNLSAKMRAFKSLYWAPRWTSTNLAIFKKVNPIALPYYTDEMCKFICTVPEKYLADRQIQIAYLKRHKNLASITWEEQKPFNLNTYHLNKSPINLPYRITNKAKRVARSMWGKDLIQRNWELQYLGEHNQTSLKSYLYSRSLLNLIPKETVDHFLNAFNEKDQVFYSHSVSMLLTLALWTKQHE